MNNRRHFMDNESKVPTLFGLLIEGFTNGLAIIGVVVYMILDQSGLLKGLPEMWNFFPQTSLLALIMRFYRIGIFVILSFTGTLFLVNLWLFSGLMRQRYTHGQAAKIYTYQLIYGVVILLIHPLIGLLYLFSGYKGKMATSNLA